MNHLHFSKYHGAGNDFIMVDGISEVLPPLPEILVAALCDRKTGIGADGLIVARKNPLNGKLAMQYFNADGREGTMCGNGGRCFASFIHFKGHTSQSINFEAIDGMHQAEILESAGNISSVKISMNDVEGITTHPLGFILDTGSPHLVIETSDINTVDVFNEGRIIRNRAEFGKNGINVNWIGRKENEVYIRTYERGVENETLSCGTGSIAAAIVASMNHRESESAMITVVTKGGVLTIGFRPSKEKFTNITLTGPATRVFEGVISL